MDGVNADVSAFTSHTVNYHLSRVKSFLTDAQTVALAIVSLNPLIHFTIKYTNQFTISNAI